ncbi:MAG: hypothetical protein O2955_07630 [Planctomycetota bacterium]|nr:hypothetical protein [Planctomycetota bacterium]MDA1212370.1 hypothetical protein [Planctomycetota bacterium]
MFSRSILIGALMLTPMVGLGCASGTQSGWNWGRSVAKSEDKTESEATSPPKLNIPSLKLKNKGESTAVADKSSAPDSSKSETPTSTAASTTHADVVHADAESTSDNIENTIEQLGGTTSGRSANPPVSHDAELLKRINSELKDLPARERAELFHDLKSLDPAMVDQVLKMRRMSLQISERAKSSSSPVKGGGHSSPLDGDVSDSELGRSTRSGLGKGDPWGSPGDSKTETLTLGESKPIQPPPRKDLELPRITPSTPTESKPLPAVDQIARPPQISADESISSNAVSNADLTSNVTPSPNSQAIIFPSHDTPDPDSGIINIASGSPAPKKTSIESLIEKTERELATLPLGTTPEEQRRFLEKHVFLRMLYWMGKQQERALQPIPGIDPADQEFWQQIFWAMTNYFDAQTIPNEADRAAQTLVQLRAAVQRLQEKAKLEIHNVAFCHKITSFGSYERFNKDEFTPGQPVLLYGEMVNFKSEPTSDGQYRTILKSTLEIYRAGPQGELVDSIPFPVTEDLCRQPRSDYFHSYEFTIPQRIILGPHVLKLVVEDQLSRKIATYSINFMVK